MKEGNNINLSVEIMHYEEFIGRTNLAMNRVENDDECWLSVDDFLKELKSW